MDADVNEKRREINTSRTDRRWSMNSQRLEEIVAELMRPIGDLRHNFDTDLSALLEEYLTEAGLHALDADAEESGAAPVVTPNFAELALLLQQSANIYGRKVDFLYQHVLSISDSLHNSTIELANTSTNEEEPQTPSTSRRKRKASVSGDFVHIELEEHEAARREAAAARPPPTLPRVYTELEPRVLHEDDTPLTDYDGEPIGLLTDFHVAWRLQDGVLVEELECAAARAGLMQGPLRPLPLLELQAALAARAPAEPPPLPLRDDSPPRDDAPACSTPLPPLAPSPPPADMPPPPLPLKRERKRKNDARIDDLAGVTVKLLISKELRGVLSRVREFECAAPWVRRVLAERAQRVLELRRRLRADHLDPFRGFEYSGRDASGFCGWSASEAGAALAAARSAARRSERRADDSDDDGFFEQSSLGDSDVSRAEDSPPHTQTAQANKAEAAAAAEAAEAWLAWRAAAEARAAAEGARPALDVRALGGAVLRRVPAAPPKPFAAVLAEEARDHSDVSRLFLATLFLANAGNVRVVRGAPLSLNSFSLRLLSDDASLLSAAAAAEPPLR